MPTHDDDFNFADDNPPPSPPGVVNEGRHTVRVSSISRGTPPWSDGLQISLRLACDDCPGTAAIFVDVPVSNTRRLEAMAAALGTDVATLVEGELAPFASKEIEVIVGHFKKRDGTVGASVKAFLPMKVEPVAEPVPAKRVNEAKPKPPAPLEITDALIEAVAKRVIALLETKGIAAPSQPAVKRPPPIQKTPRAAERAKMLLDDDGDIPF